MFKTFIDDLVDGVRIGCIHASLFTVKLQDKYVLARLNHKISHADKLSEYADKLNQQAEAICDAANAEYEESVSRIQNKYYQLKETLKGNVNV